MLSRIRDLLSVFNPKHVSEAKNYFASITPQTAIEELDILSRDADSNVRTYSLIFTFELFPVEAGKMMTPLLSDVDPHVRWHACKFASMIQNNSNSIEPLSKIVLSDEFEFVRDMAAFALGNIGDLSVLPILMQAYLSENGTDHEGQPIKVTIKNAIDRIESRMKDINT